MKCIPPLTPIFTLKLRYTVADLGGGFMGFARAPSGPKLFHFHEDFQVVCGKLENKHPSSTFEHPLQKSLFRHCIQGYTYFS